MVIHSTILNMGGEWQRKTPEVVFIFYFLVLSCVLLESRKQEAKEANHEIIYFTAMQEGPTFLTKKKKKKWGNNIGRGRWRSTLLFWPNICRSLVTCATNKGGSGVDQEFRRALYYYYIYWLLPQGHGCHSRSLTLTLFNWSAK